MSLFRKVFGDKSAAQARTPEFEDSEEDVSRQRSDARRDAVHAVFVETIGRHGIPSDWLECRTMSLAHGERRGGTYVVLVVRDGQDRLLPYAPAFQASLREGLERFDPRVGDWLGGIAWQFDERQGAAGAPKVPAAAPAAASATAIPASGLADAPSDAPAAPDDLEADLRALFATRDAALGETAEPSPSKDPTSLR